MKINMNLMHKNKECAKIISKKFDKVRSLKNRMTKAKVCSLDLWISHGSNMEETPERLCPIKGQDPLES